MGVQERRLVHSTPGATLADLLEKVLDKGVVVAGDIKVLLADVELLTIKVRLIICSVERAMAMGINWWQSDPYLSRQARPAELPPSGLQHRIEQLEARVRKLDE